GGRPGTCGRPDGPDSRLGRRPWRPARRSGSDRYFQLGPVFGPFLASEQHFESVRLVSVRLVSVRLVSVRLVSVRLVSVRLVSVQCLGPDRCLEHADGTVARLPVQPLRTPPPPQRPSSPPPP